MITETEIRNVALALFVERGSAPGSEPECRAVAERLLAFREVVAAGETGPDAIRAAAALVPVRAAL